MKKSMLMLVALFMLGACSTVSDTLQEWSDLVGGKTVKVYNESISDYTSVGTFTSPYASAYNLSNSGTRFHFKESTSNGATYTNASSTIIFSDMTSKSGTFKRDSDTPVNFSM